MHRSAPRSSSLARGALRFSRRRYGRTCYTWADVFNGAEWISLGDPYPAVHWSKRVLREEVQRVLGAASASGLDRHEAPAAHPPSC